MKIKIKRNYNYLDIFNRFKARPERFVMANLGYIIIGFAFVLTMLSIWLTYDPIIDGPSFLARMEVIEFKDGFFYGVCMTVVLVLLVPEGTNSK